MRISSTEWIPSRTMICCTRKQRSKRSKIRVQRLNRRKRECEEKVGKDMELKNLKLYKENITIMEENEKLRKKASLLHQENLALMTEFQKKFSHFDRLSTAIFLLQNSRIK
ncbi:protein LITTLE ZIPPER 1-like isoform X2 [Actinidia eriantha]|uniref:protein LITTLE ZIPPER 1-like isoform X2 n=1 Tax=Actinidia eriantha TaxID=165200 RepID=UPI0025903497|nr:protein LITTLE ZIPPER 1-like isoform X2 [Actinidia eriantha]